MEFSQGDDIEIVAETALNEERTVAVLLHDEDDKAHAWHIPLLPANGNMLFANVSELANGIIGIGWRTKSGRKMKVGWADASCEQLRYELNMWASFYNYMMHAEYLCCMFTLILHCVYAEVFFHLRPPAIGWGSNVYFCIYQENIHPSSEQHLNQQPTNMLSHTDGHSRDPNNFITVTKGPLLDIEKMMGNVERFGAWRCQWSAYMTSSGLENLWHVYPTDNNSETGDDAIQNHCPMTERSKQIQQKTRRHHLAALQTAMTRGTLQIVNNLDGLPKDESLITADAVIDALEKYIIASPSSQR